MGLHEERNCCWFKKIYINLYEADNAKGTCDKHCLLAIFQQILSSVKKAGNGQR
jgi:hypothetical protein